MNSARVTVVVVVYGNRWHLLQQVADSVLREPKVTTFIIVDNGCADAAALDALVQEHGDRIILLRQDRNIGYSGAISKGLSQARETKCDFVFVLDDDCVPEENAVDYFLDNLKLFPDRKVVLVGNRIDVPGNAEIFYRPILQKTMPRGTLFEVFSFSKILRLFRLLFRKPEPATGPFVPVVPMEAFVTGGSFLPIEAVREAPLPDPNLFIYGEDLEYSWRIRRLGYSCYACARPIIRDIDMTFPKEGDHVFGLFDPAFPLYKVYFRIRNAIVISKRNTVQKPGILLANIIVRTSGLILIGLLKSGLTRSYVTRARIMIRAAVDGYRYPRPIPTYIEVPK